MICVSMLHNKDDLCQHAACVLFEIPPTAAVRSRKPVLSPPPGSVMTH